MDIPETSLDSIDIMKLLQSVRVDLPSSQLHEICDFIGTGQKYDALASQIRVSGQISISAGSQPIQVNVEAKAENFYLHVGDHKVRMTEVKTEMEQAAATCTFTFTCMCYSLSPWLTGDSNANRLPGGYHCCRGLHQSSLHFCEPFPFLISSFRHFLFVLFIVHLLLLPSLLLRTF